MNKQTTDRAPQHPRTARRIVAAITTLMVLLALGGWPLFWWITAHVESVRASVMPHHRWLVYAQFANWCAALVVLALVAAGLGSVVVRWAVWWITLFRTTGSYWRIVVPEPQGKSGTVTPRDQHPPLWAHLVGTLAAAPHPQYCAVELWGTQAGRVAWGIWLPAKLAKQTDAVRRLITAERSDARLVRASDPLGAALDPSADATHVYATAVLMLRAPSHYPLAPDALALPSVVAALRPGPGVLAVGLSQIIAPAPTGWASTARRWAARLRWDGRERGRHDPAWKAAADALSVKAAQPSAAVVLRVHVVGTSRAVALAECDSLIGTLTAPTHRYPNGTVQGWRVVLGSRRVRAGGVPRRCAIRAPWRPKPPLPPIWPLT